MVAGETPDLTGESVGGDHRILQCTQVYPPRNQHMKGTIHLWEAREVTESEARAKQAASFLLRPLPHIQRHKAAERVALPWWIPKVLPPYNITGTLRQRNMAQMKELIKLQKNN